MTTPTPPLPHYNIILSLTFVVTLIITSVTSVNSLGSASTVAVTYATATICAIVAGDTKQFIKCYQQQQQNESKYNNYDYPTVAPPVVVALPDDFSFQAISGGRSFFCGLRSDGLNLYCWNTNVPGSVFLPKRIYHSDAVQLTDVTVGDSQVCARELHSGVVRCWRGGSVKKGFEFHSPGEEYKFRSITSGCCFSCGILMDNGKVLCWGNESKNNASFSGNEIQAQFGNLSMSSLVAGVSHVCGLTIEGILVCKGNNDSGQLNVPLGSGPSEFSSLALGEKFTCAIRRRNGLVLCWGSGFNSSEFGVGDVSFELIVAGLDFVCGVTTMNLSVMCWGNGWLSSSNKTNNLISEIPLGMVLPGMCVKGGCGSCASYPNSGFLCHGSGSICYSCQTQIPLAVPLIPPNSTKEVPQEQNSSDEDKNMRVFLGTLIVGSVGAFAGLCTILYFLWIGTRRFLLKGKVDDSVQPSRTESDAYVDMVPMPNRASNATTLGSSSSKKQNNSGKLRRHRSGNSSSSKHVEKTESFSLYELAISTNNFSAENKIGAGSFGSVYKGKLEDGREVAIKRGDTSTRKKKFQEKEIAFDSELALLSRLHHKHLVKLIGFCEENDERLLVYEYMSNRSLHDHLHDKNNVDKSSSILNSWKMRIKIALDAARGIEYIHNYAVPPIIHRDIKSSNILLDSNWNARVSDFGLSLIWPETEQELMSTKAVGTVGYIDPEYYVLNVLNTKSDVYGLGVVLLELLTGKRAVFKTEDNKFGPVGVVEYAVPRIASGDIWSLLDNRVGKPEVNEVESIKIMAYTAVHCVNLEGKERPDMTEIVARLERALDFFEGSPTNISIASCSKRFVI